MNQEELLQKLAQVADDKRALDIVALDVQGLTTLADYFLIFSTMNSRQLDTLADHLLEAAQAAGVSTGKPEGESQSGWVLLDFGGIIVHIFSEEGRSHYQLEKLWHEAAQVELNLDTK
ncbi:ribosome silencing factor [Streptococcus sp. DD12]|uniref:ribosome silencing factor n=1 Tax=Streptococcus sp. DD12 TaxID=1777880 RepID=UPI00079576C2|nr:ribosome silencing factor [Streptococcus sp. DD12]KXT76662.1 Iojap protein [Streptococcus sp. DD12]